MPMPPKGSRCSLTQAVEACADKLVLAVLHRATAPRGTQVHLPRATPRQLVRIFLFLAPYRADWTGPDRTLQMRSSFMASFVRPSRLLKHELRLQINPIQYPFNPTILSVGTRLEQVWVLPI
jgi:hypothetical protein